MAIELITGTPGAGKTLYTLYNVKKRAETEKRTVYYNGIPDCNIPGWVLLEDPQDWYKLPAGALIVLDECQRLFRPRHSTQAVPRYVEKLETHRHSGYDIYLITQHPTLIETNVRRLCDMHHHLMRKFGSRWATVHSWKGVKENCDKTRKDSMTKEFRYPKEVFSWYKSAEVHTHKFRLPAKIWLAMLVPVVLGFSSWFAFQKLVPPEVQNPEMNRPAGTQSGGRSLAELQSGGKPQQQQQKDAEPYTLESVTPRVEGLAFSAPRYDSVTQPITAPYPAACVASRKKCGCFTQQATPLNMPDDLCRNIARNGVFIDFDVSRSIVQQEPRQEPLQDGSPLLQRSGQYASVDRPMSAAERADALMIKSSR